MAAPAKIISSVRSWLGHYRLLAILSILSLLVVLFIVLPLTKLIFVSNKGELWQALLKPTIMKSILLTLYAALITAAIGFLLRVPLAYLLARNS